ncbi:accessory Sec system S-layer assembly protein [Paenisporosarcina quisquiliarum]|uniref:accessory Sec system S-layer assembly protein n=1 Tax=Paenisporosarcina quisquiliarum TaxID=365346 RepID=UPI0037350B2D
MKIPFFKKKDSIQNSTAKESNASVEQFDLESEMVEDVLISTSLSFHPEATIQPEDRYYFQFLLNELSPLKRNQISISPIELKIEESEVHAQVFFRQSLKKEVQLGSAELLLMNGAGQVQASQTFDLAEVGQLPAESARPWIVTFNQQSFKVPIEQIKTTDWTVAFKLASPHRLELSEEWETSLAEDQKERLHQLVAGLTPPKVNEINLMGLEAKQDEEGKLIISILIRNGQEKNIEISQLPLVVTDASKVEVARGGFTLPPLTVKANTSKPWTFIFPREMVVSENIDLSKWKVQIQQ